MKLLRHGPSGSEKPGIVDAEGQMRDLTGHVDDIAGHALTPEGLESLAAIDPSTLPPIAEGTRIGPCVGAVGKFICIGLNYSDHAAETGQAVPEEHVRGPSRIAYAVERLRPPCGLNLYRVQVQLRRQGILKGASENSSDGSGHREYVRVGGRLGVWVYEDTMHLLPHSRTPICPDAYSQNA